MPFLCLCLPGQNLPQEPIVRVQDSVPCDGGRVYVQTSKPPHFFRCEVVGVPLINAQLLQPPHLNGGELPSSFILRHKTAK